MKKSIETIWKEGFLKKDALIVPKLNDLYGQKSIDIVAKFRRMYKINIIAIVVFAFIFLPLAVIVRIPYMGIPLFFLFMTIVYFAIGFKKELDTIDKNVNSYQYLQSFNNWIKKVTTFNIKLSRYLYPYVFLSMVAGFWFGSIGGNIPGEESVNWLLVKYPDMMILFGLPLVGIVGLITIVGLLAFFGGKIGEWDFNIGYGRIVRRLNGLLKDMEELRASC